MEMKEYKPGTFCWVDLMSTDAAASKKFYSALFNWEVNDMPIPGGGEYTFLQLRGKEVAALSQMPPDMQKSGMPSVWSSYISVADADATQKQAEAAGATTIAKAFDVMDAGRMAVLADPTGAMFSVWQPKRHHGAALVNEPSAFCWNELLTRDTDAAKKFYAKVFGWTDEGQDMGPMGTYTTFKVGDRNNGGMMKMPEGNPAPNFWGVYFAVPDVDASVKKAKELGATVHVPPTDIPGTGRFAMLQDPQGAVFSVITLSNPGT